MLSKHNLLCRRKKKPISMLIKCLTCISGEARSVLFVISYSFAWSLAYELKMQAEYCVAKITHTENCTREKLVCRLCPDGLLVELSSGPIITDSYVHLMYIW